MTKFSLCCHCQLRICLVSLLLSVVLIAGGCYSFTGGSVPPHLKTIAIATVADRSSFGQPIWREVATQLLIERFRNDNTLQLVDRDGDAELRAAITSITEEPGYAAARRNRTRAETARQSRGRVLRRRQRAHHFPPHVHQRTVLPNCAGCHRPRPSDSHCARTNHRRCALGGRQ